MHSGLIVSSYGRQFIVEVDGLRYQSVTRAKKTEFVVGDQVQVQILNQEQAQIMELQPRHSLIYRSDHNRSKIIASNLKQIIIVIAVKPNFNLSFLNSCLLCAEASNIAPLIVINKLDLSESIAFAAEIEELFAQRLGYNILRLAATEDCQLLQPWLSGKRSLLIGQSGVGKSTITNQICPEAFAKTGAITKYETSGSHTTTNATLYHVDEHSDLIDCPGLQEFGLNHLELSEAAEYFPEMRPFLGSCKFNNCIHNNEPGCAVRAAVEREEIDAQRYAYYQRLVSSLQLKKNY